MYILMQNLFEKVYQMSEDKFNKSISHYASVEDTKLKEEGKRLNYRLTLKTLHNITNLSTYVEYLEQKDKCFKTIYFKLYVYLQIVECKYIYKVFGNLLRCLKNEEPDGELYDINYHSGNKCFEDIKKFKTNETSDFIDKWQKFIITDLRNAIAHNDYYIDSKSKTMIIPSYILKSLNNAKSNNQNMSNATYTFDDINNYYNQAVDFANKFIKLISKYVNLGRKY